MKRYPKNAGDPTGGEQVMLKGMSPEMRKRFHEAAREIIMQIAREDANRFVKVARKGLIDEMGK